MENIETT